MSFPSGAVRIPNPYYPMITDIALSKQDGLTKTEPYTIDIGLQSIPPDDRGRTAGPFTVRVTQSSIGITGTVNQKTYPNTQTSAHFDLQSIFDATHGGQLSVRVSQTFLGFSRFDGYDIPMNVATPPPPPPPPPPTAQSIVFTADKLNPSSETDAVTLTALAKDASGNPVPNVQLIYHQDGAEIGFIGTTNSAGIYSWQLTFSVGTHSLFVSNGTINSNTLTITVAAPPPPPPPPPPTDTFVYGDLSAAISVSNITAGSAEVTGTITNLTSKSGNIGIVIEIKDPLGVVIAIVNPVVSIAANGTAQHTLVDSNLEANTTYSGRTFALDGTLTTLLSNTADAPFTTLDVMPPPPPPPPGPGPASNVTGGIHLLKMLAVFGMLIPAIAPSARLGYHAAKKRYKKPPVSRGTKINARALRLFVKKQLRKGGGS